MDVVEKARVFATAAHAAVNQLRKYTFDPYIVHPTEVATIVATVTDNPNVVATAYLHDVLEDTKVTEEVLRREFGDEVTDLVVWLTNVSKPSDGNRKVRKQKDLNNLAKAPADAQTVKLADLLSNTPSIVEYDPNFAKIYLHEKLALLDVLKKGNSDLWQQAFDVVQWGCHQLEDRKK